MKILVPTDFSANAHKAAKYALYLAERTNADILLLHTYAPPVNMEDMTGTLVEMEQANREELEKEMARLNELIAHDGSDYVKVEADLKVGFAADQIVEASKPDDVELIVMGTTGASGLKKIIGSVASKVASNADMPTILVPDDAPVNPIHKIAYATDFDDADNESIDALNAFARVFSAEVHIVHVSEDTNLEDELDMEDLEERYGLISSDIRTHFQLIEE